MTSRLHLLLPLLALFVLGSCQSQPSSSDSSATSPIDVYLSANANRIHPPDSILPFHAVSDSGDALRSPILPDSSYRYTIHLSRPLNGDVLKVQYKSFGLNLFTVKLIQDGSSRDLVVHSVDTTIQEKLSLKLLDRFDSIRTQSPAYYSKRTDPVANQIADLRLFFAKLLLAGDSSFPRFSSSIPAGLDTVGLRDQVLVLGVATGKPLSELVKNWSLDLDSSQARAAILVLVARGAITDTAKVFPPRSVRLRQALAVVPNPITTGTRAIVSGSFSWNPGPLPAISATISRNGSNSPKVRVLSSVSLAQTDTTLSLENGYLVEVDPTADTGAYVLAIQLTNGGDVVRSEARFRVVPPDHPVDATAPALSIISPSKDTTVPNGTASLLVVATATDSAGIDSVKIDGHKLTTSPYTSTIDLAVGADTILVQAWDKSGLRSSKSVVVTRSKSLDDTTKPVIKRLLPTKDTMVEYSTSNISLSWTVTDDSALAKVTLNDTALTSTSANYGRLQNLSVGKNIFVLKAYDAHGNPVSDTVVVVRGSYHDKIAPSVIAADSATVSKTIPFEVASLRLSWRVLDNDVLQKVKIQDSVVKGELGVFFQIVNLPLGKSVWVIQATDTANNSTIDSVVIFRETKDTVRPVIRMSSDSKLNLPFDSVSTRISWMVADNHKLKEVKINDAVVSSKDGVYGIDLNLTVGSRTIRITAVDSTGNIATDSIIVVRNPDRVPPVITRIGDYSGIYYYSAIPEWIKISVDDNDSIASVTIQGDVALFLNGVYSFKAPLVPGVNLIPIEVVDRSDNHSYDTIRLTTRLIDRAGNSYSVAKMPDGKYWTTQNIYAEPRFLVDTAYGVRLGLCAYDSCQKYGRYYSWSMALNLESKCDTSFCGVDSTNIQGLCPNGSHVPRGSEWAALLKAVDPSSDSLAAIKLKSKSNEGLWGTFEYDPSGGLLPVNNESGTDAYGFHLLPSLRVGTGGYGAPSRSLRLARMILSNEFDATSSVEARFFNGVHIQENGKDLAGGSLRCVMD